ncbi:DUF808 domain-containing protein, partial [Rathayibacter sp. AY1E8]
MCVSLEVRGERAHSIASSAVERAGPVVVWLADTFVSMIFGLVLGLVIAAVV